jgi:hypothetical protein
MKATFDRSAYLVLKFLPLLAGITIATIVSMAPIVQPTVVEIISAQQPLSIDFFIAVRITLRVLFWVGLVWAAYRTYTESPKPAN